MLDLWAEVCRINTFSGYYKQDVKGGGDCPKP